jgi:heme/copper-type cytochrome/quinol oxidase subunit 1
MEPFVRRFIRSSLVWLGVGVVLGVWLTLDPGAVVYRPAHMHANLLGFVSMMIFGVAYHVLPRFTGRPLRSRRLAAAHLIVANAGLAAMVLGWMLRLAQPEFGQIALASGGVLSGAGAFMFIGNLWLTLGPAAGPQVLRATPTVRG